MKVMIVLGIICPGHAGNVDGNSLDLRLRAIIIVIATEILKMSKTSR